MRGITNHSSGKMGFAVARAAQEAGAQVTSAGLVSLPTPAWGCAVLMCAIGNRHAGSPWTPPQPRPIFVACAAVADWRPAQASEQKIKKDGSRQTPTLTFLENPDIPATLPSHRVRETAACSVGFAAESHDLLAHATDKRI
ncbi:phosphopantothenoylcysteine decarboxylase [Candidatus Aalborgicola defluviihabitans]|uniref:phosphopantothenoylcysteine decarboxylase n=1 Tax=Candidatus Aalborgicola defluviihabitans TaxID=3386187 RepID=UPI0039B93B2A